MGWKKLKEKYGITHYVAVTEAGIYIGSGFVPDLIVVNPETGAVHESSTFGGFLREHYPALQEASPAEILAVLQEKDEFSADIPVYTYDGGTVIEKLCETPGWPNATHDGCLMYENTFSVDKELIVKRAKRNALLAVQYSREDVERRERELVEARARVAEYERQACKLDEDYPDIAVAG